MSRREARRQGRRDAILSVATRHFLDHGYSATTMSSIAATLGGSKGTLWSYFPSKEALFTAVIDEATTNFRTELSQILDPCGDLRTTLLNISRRVIEKITSPGAIALNRLVVAESGRFPELGQIFYERAPLQAIMLIADFLSGAMTRGQLRAEDPMDAAHFLLYQSVNKSQQQLIMRLKDEINAEQVEEEANRAVNLFLRAFGQKAENEGSLECAA